jgi:hypothetical protein
MLNSEANNQFAEYADNGAEYLLYIMIAGVIFTVV